jgi:hypothetical protein
VSKKPSLAAALHQASGQPVAVAAPEAPSRAALVRREHGAEALPKPSRAGTRAIGGHFDPAVARQLRLIAADEGATIQQLLREALNDLFQKRGRQPIA